MLQILYKHCMDASVPHPVLERVLHPVLDNVNTNVRDIRNGPVHRFLRSAICFRPAERG